MSTTTGRLRQVVDWSAAVWAGVIAGIIFLILNVLVAPLFLGGNAWIALRYTASILLGERVLPPPATFDLWVLIVALLVYFAMAIAFAVVLALIIHRWGMIVGIIGGALFGLALYFINFYTLTYFYPWFFAIQSWVLLLSHVIFGAVAGGVYESLEVEEFVVVDSA
jgi:hypothetical protein